MRNVFRVTAGSLLILLFGATASWSDNSSARGVVEGFQTTLVDVMKRARKLGVQGRFEALKPVIENRFHQPLMIATASAPYWKSGSAEDRSILLAAFRRMSASTLATLFDDYNEERFEITQQRKISKRVTMVDTRIIRTNDEPVDISYVAADMKKRWWIIDIIVSGGISEVKARKSEYSAFLKQGGLRRLAQALDLRADRLLSGQETALPQ